MDWAKHEAAQFAVVNWHYSRRLPQGKLVKVGAWEDGVFIGCVVFARGATPNLCSPYGLSQIECVELARVALKRGHATPVSRVAAIAIRMLKKSTPSIRLIVSFADMAQGHHGGIYQAGNWTYTGAVELPTWIINGEPVHPRSVVTKYGSQATALVQTLDRNATRTTGIKHRYVLALDAAMREQVKPLAQPYPKRTTRAKDQAAEIHPSALGGETPTRALPLQAA